MRGLLLAIQKRLRTIEDIRDRDVFLPPDRDLVPAHAKFPCIGILGGTVTRSYAAAGAVILTLPTQIHVYQQLCKSDESVLSILKTAEDVQAALKDNYLDDYVRDVTPGSESYIDILPRDTRLVLKKTLNFEYEREED